MAEQADGAEGRAAELALLEEAQAVESAELVAAKDRIAALEGELRITSVALAASGDERESLSGELPAAEPPEPQDYDTIAGWYGEAP